MLTVAQLMNVLQRSDPDMPIAIEVGDSYYDSYDLSLGSLGSATHTSRKDPTTPVTYFVITGER